MASHANGRFPERLFIEAGSGRDMHGVWKHLFPAGTYARWTGLVADAKKQYGVTLRVTPGWNVYRPLAIQQSYRDYFASIGRPTQAAWPGTSSHGGVYNGRDSMAIDVQNWKDLAPGNERLAWQRFAALCKKWGFTVDFVSPQELWHIGDFNPWVAPSPVATDAEPLPTPDPEEVIMKLIYNLDDKNEDTRRAEVGELSFVVLGAPASTAERVLWGNPENVDNAGWASALSLVNRRRSQLGLPALKGERGEESAAPTAQISVAAFAKAVLDGLHGRLAA